MRIAVPDLISNSYFPVIAAAELGLFEREGIDLTLELISPLGECVKALKDGYVSFIGVSAHAPLLAFRDWQGAKLLCAQAQGTYWFLVMRKDLDVTPGDLSSLRNCRIGAVPFVGAALAELLKDAGVDPDENNIEISMPAETRKPGVNFGVAVVQALRDGTIDGFFANGMGAAVACAEGIGRVVLDVRRGDGPPNAFNYTFGAVATTDTEIEARPEAAAAVVRAIGNVQRLLRSDITQATVAAKRLFPAREAAMIAPIVAADLPYYVPSMSPDSVRSMNAYARRVGLLSADVGYEQVVATQFRHLWAA